MNFTREGTVVGVRYRELCQVDLSDRDQASHYNSGQSGHSRRAQE